MNGACRKKGLVRYFTLQETPELKYSKLKGVIDQKKFVFSLLYGEQTAAWLAYSARFKLTEGYVLKKVCCRGSA